uniref:Junction-mediating and -regulatory protein-like n=1 Tax=Petromyzon marinus TaxID=7757 RepID=A0AAJ7XJX7_PETMA|nr:junction-mediating and -regulatory protein-like [Petromyzon marinus]
MSDREIHEGIRELCEGCLKYSGDTLAFEDLVMFITATRRTAHDATHHPHVQRRGSGLHPAPSHWEPQYKLPLTQELRALLAATKTPASADAPVSRPPPPPPPPPPPT